MRWLALFAALGLVAAAFGCGGGAGGPAAQPVAPGPTPGVALSGTAYFADRQLYGGIPILVRDLTGRLVAATRTDVNGRFAFPTLPAGVYDISASAGDAEVVFAAGVQITGAGRALPEVSLLGIQTALVDQIGAYSVRITFRTNKPALSSVEYGPAGDFPITQPVSQFFATDHRITLMGLSNNMPYGFAILLVGEDGQKFRYDGLSARTTSGLGPSQLSIAINNGAYETQSPVVTLTLLAKDALLMRVGSSEDLSGLDWEAYSPEKSWTFDATPGPKRVFCQFRDAAGLLSPVIGDSILLTAGSGGYAGVWINGGRPYATDTAAVLTLLYPGAEQMMLAPTSAFTLSFWEPYVQYRRWTLSSGDGEKTVYAKFSGGGADPTRVYSASIYLDTSIPTGTMVINSGAAKTATTAVQLEFAFRNVPVSMQISNETPPASSTPWESYVTPKPWKLAAVGSGTRTVYARFRTRTNLEFGPLSDTIEVDDTPPVGNAAAIRSSADPQAATLTSTLAASLPVYLHFDVVDASTERADYAITAGSVTSPLAGAFKSIGRPFRPIALTSGAFPAAESTIWYRFVDEIGNTSSLGYFPFTIDGPRLIVTPAEMVVRSDDRVQFTAVATRTVGDIGPINWFLTGPGTINNGLYVAPSLIANEATAVVTARSSYQPELSAQALVYLKRRVELAVSEPPDSTERPLTVVSRTLGFNTSVSYLVTVYNSTAPFDLYESPDSPQGTVAITDRQVLADRYRARLTYSSPALGGATFTTTVRIRPRDNPSASGTFNFSVDEIPNLNLSPLQVDNATPGAPVTLTAQVQSTTAEEVAWSIHDGAGSFDPVAEVTTKVTSTSHQVQVYGRDTRQVETIKVQAQLVSRPTKMATSTITVIPPVRVLIYRNVNLTERFPNDTADTVAEVGKIQFYAEVTPRNISDTSVTWTVNGGAGDSTTGTISPAGLYTAPEQVTLASVRVKATSKYDTSASHEISVRLSDFWALVRGNMVDRVTGAPMPVNVVAVHPYTAIGKDFQVFAGTSGYGVWNSALPDTIPATSSHYPWKGVQGLSINGYDPDLRYVITALAIRPDGRGMFAATLKGLYFIPFPASFNNGVVPDLTATHVDLDAVGIASQTTILTVTMGRTSDEVFLSTSRAVWRVATEIVGTTMNPVQSNTVLDLENPTREWETRSETVGSPPVTIYVTALSNQLQPNPLLGVRIHSLAYDAYNDRLFAGGEQGSLLNIGQTETGNLTRLTNTKIFSGSAGIDTYLGTAYVKSGVPVQSVTNSQENDLFLALALDPNTRTTLWCASVTGLKRSTNSGRDLISISFGGSSVNTKSVLVDPTNVINVMSGSEDGLYRSTDAGSSWTRIRSGLGNHKTINSLAQASGAAGERRRVWVGTTGGVFLGRQSLDLE
ncbi:MAG: hypothetical protein OZSIB_3866 [Candidatus Ozemobacter sibiricus]|uniref:Uncharacterized protein n=1 Tax=Candidatus Ozemobacter sibiricus TaxID=2268124 RepID=A0A367ZQ87_9BACT|nr:MAG: hypothetical protein OZSIB_3866 [Candidatus Ozemobacter sibiricus]